MKIIYISCFVDPWLKIAEKLRRERGYEPVYWVGYEYDNSRALVPEAFPGIIYHPIFDAFKGIPPQGEFSSLPQAPIDIDFLRASANDEIMAMQMMDRMDPDRYSFNLMERQRHFRNLMRYWDACLDRLNPNLVVCERVPHQVFDYVLYLLCRRKGIPFLTFILTPFLGRVIPVTEISSIGGIFDAEYARNMASDLTIDDLKNTLADDIKAGMEKLRLDYGQAEPPYMKKHILEHKKNSSLFSLSRKFLADMLQSRREYFGRNGYLMRGIPTFFKERHKSVGESSTSVVAYARLKLKANRFRKKLRKNYDSLAQSPDLSVPYVIFNLHYQPELTSNPSGGIFADQRLCIDALAKNLPGDHWIYVKEHRSQLYSHLLGQTGRTLDYYQDMLAHPRVRLMPLDGDPFELMKHSRAVATVTGTCGWEAMVMGKPVLAFGLSWYERYPGVLRIRDEESAKKIADFIANYNYSERALVAYLNAFQVKTIKVYSQRNWYERLKEDKTSSIQVLADCIAQWLPA